MEELYRQYVQIVYRFLVSACRNPGLAEDLTQGHIAPLPVRGKSGKDPCSYCEYRQLGGNADGPVFREICGEQKGEEEEP